MSKVHFISLDKDHWVAFFPETCRFFRTNIYGKQLIESVLEGTNTVESLAISERDFSSYSEKILSYANKYDQIRDEHITLNQITEKHLDRLVIHVSNDCNLRCRYCYAAGGAYGSDRSIMSMEMLQTILDKFYDAFNNISTIQIFGGEPLYNLPAIRQICEYVRTIDHQRNLDTRIGIVTNATLITNEFIDLVKNYGISVTVSYDGNPLVNDLVRVYANGRGTTADILRKTKQLYEATQQPETIEVTYTQYHVDNGVGILDVIKYMKELFPKINVHLVPVCGEGEQDFLLNNYKLFPKSIDEIFELQEQGEVFSYSLADRIFVGLSQKEHKNPYICNAGVGTLSVSVDGDIYPCFMFTNEKELRLGNINDDNVLSSDRFVGKLNKLAQFNNKSNNSVCKDCFMRSICNGCLGLNATHKGDEFAVNHEVCDFFREMMEHAILQYIHHGLISEANNE